MGAGDTAPTTIATGIAIDMNTSGIAPKMSAAASNGNGAGLKTSVGG